MFWLFGWKAWDLRSSTRIEPAAAALEGEVSLIDHQGSPLLCVLLKPQTAFRVICKHFKRVFKSYGPRKNNHSNIKYKKGDI